MTTTKEQILDDQLEILDDQLDRAYYAGFQVALQHVKRDGLDSAEEECTRMRKELRTLRKQREKES